MPGGSEAPEAQQQPAQDLPVGLAQHAGRCPPAGGPEAGEVSRLARPGPASPFPAEATSHPVSFHLRQRRGMWRGRLGSSDAWVRSSPVHERRALGPDAGVPAAGTWARKQVSLDWGPWRGSMERELGAHSPPRTLIITLALRTELSDLPGEAPRES